MQNIVRANLSQSLHVFVSLQVFAQCSEALLNGLALGTFQLKLLKEVPSYELGILQRALSFL
jgi:hypothetical protein